MTLLSYQTAYTRHAAKMRAAATIAQATIAQTLGIHIRELQFGFPAFDFAQATNSSTAPTSLNVWNINSNVTQTNATPNRYETINWGIGIKIRDTDGKSGQSYQDAVNCARLAAEVIERYVADYSNDEAGYCIRVDQLGVDAFRPEGATGAVAIARVGCVLGSKYDVRPITQPPSMPPLLTPGRDGILDVALTLSTLGPQALSLETSTGKFTSLSTTTTPPGATSVCACVGTYGGSSLAFRPTNGWALDLETNTYITPLVDADGLQFVFDPFDPSYSGSKTLSILVWSVDPSGPTNVWSGVVTITTPIPSP